MGEREVAKRNGLGLCVVVLGALLPILLGVLLVGSLLGRPQRLLGRDPCRLLGRRPRRRLGCLAGEGLFETTDLRCDRGVGFIDLATHRLPVGNPQLHLGPQLLGFHTRHLELAETALEQGSFVFGRGSGVGCHPTGGFLVGFCGAELVDDVELVACQLVEEGLAECHGQQVVAVELFDHVEARSHVGIDGHLLEPVADGIHLIGQLIDFAAGGRGPRFGGRNRGFGVGDLRLLQGDVGVERLQRVDQLLVLRTERVELGRNVGRVPAFLFTLLTQPVDGLTGSDGSSDEDKRCERDYEHGAADGQGHRGTNRNRNAKIPWSREDPRMPLSDYRIEPFTNEGRTHDVYRRGDGPCVLVAAEVPGITPKVTEFADRLVELGLSVAMPSMFGTPGKDSTMPRALRVILRCCIAREFHCLATRASAPATAWLRALARKLHAEHGGPGIGFVGMCFTGGFGLAMLLDDAVIAPVLSQPSQPFPLGSARKANPGLDDEQLKAVAERAADGCSVLGLRFTGDPIVPAERFATLREALGDNFVGVEITSPDADLDIPKDAHSVLTEHLQDIPGHPTRAALDQVLEFLNDRLTRA